jgi:NAD(P)-dependent dehydrogenase (short-subunit alcohol dehydrogenase family)
VAVVTGGASGIGAATSRRLVAEGARVGIGDINAEGAELLAKELGDGAIGIGFDAADVASVEQLVTATVEHFGRLDILHNNAAIMAPDVIARDTNPVDIDFEIWDRTFEVNVRGYLAGCKYAIPHMLDQGGARSSTQLPDRACSVIWQPSPTAPRRRPSSASPGTLPPSTASGVFAATPSIPA